MPGTRLVGDITYLTTGDGWLYLATVIDLATRMVVGWQTADHLRTSLVVDALAMAHRHGHVRPGAVFHSDRGQYTSAEFAAFCARNRIRTSVGRTGVCYDNAMTPPDATPVLECSVRLTSNNSTPHQITAVDPKPRVSGDGGKFSRKFVYCL